MKALRILGLALGIVMMLMGLLWVGQGLGLVMWPAESFMLADRVWARNGAILAAFGLALVLISARSGRRR